MADPSGELWGCSECSYQTRIFQTGETHICPRCPVETNEVYEFGSTNAVDEVVVSQQELAPIDDDA